MPQHQHENITFRVARRGLGDLEVLAPHFEPWRLVEEILDAIASARKTFNIELSPAGTARALRFLYRVASLEGRVKQEHVDDFIQLGTGFTE